MKVKMIDRSGNPRFDSYFRKQGIYCFDFVYGTKYASELTQEEAEKIIDGKEYYMKMFGAKDLVIVNE